MRHKIINNIICVPYTNIQELLNSLDNIKTNSTEISKSLNESLNVQSKLESECQVFKPFSSYASSVYFALKDLFNVNRFCQISLMTFVKLFQSTLKVINEKLILLFKNKYFFHHKSHRNLPEKQTKRKDYCIQFIITFQDHSLKIKD